MPKTSQIRLPNRLRELRKARNLTLHQLAEMTGIAFTNIGKMETGGRDVKSWHMIKFAEALGVPVADLFNTEDGGLTPEERRLVETYREVSDNGRKVFDAVTEGHQHMRAHGAVLPFPTSK